MRKLRKTLFFKGASRMVIAFAFSLGLFMFGNYHMGQVYGKSIVADETARLKIEDVKVLEEVNNGDISFDRDQAGYLDYILGDLGIFGVDSAEDAITVLEAYEETFDINKDIEYKLTDTFETQSLRRYDFDVKYKGFTIDDAYAMVVVAVDNDEVQKISVNVYDDQLRGMLVWDQPLSDLQLLSEVLFSNILDVMYFVIGVNILIPLILGIIHMVRYKRKKLFGAYVFGGLGMILQMIVNGVVCGNIEQPIIYAIMVGVIGALCLYLPMKLSKGAICWERSVAVGLGYSSIFIIFNYSLALWVNYTLKLVNDSIVYIREPDGGRIEIVLMNGSIINNVEVISSANYLILLFEAALIMIMAIAITALIGACMAQQKDLLGAVISGAMIAVIVCLIEILGARGYFVYGLIGIVAILCIFVTYRIERR